MRWRRSKATSQVPSGRRASASASAAKPRGMGLPTSSRKGPWRRGAKPTGVRPSSSSRASAQWPRSLIRVSVKSGARCTPENPPPPKAAASITNPPSGRRGPGRSGSANGCAAFCALADAAPVAPSAARKARRETRGSCAIAFYCVRPPWRSVRLHSAARLPPHLHRTIRRASSSWCRPVLQHPQWSPRGGNSA